MDAPRLLLRRQSPPGTASLIDSGLGTAQKYHNLTFTSFLTTLFGALGLFVIQVAVFIVVQRKGLLPSIYYPRSSKYTVAKYRVPAPPPSVWRWSKNVVMADETRFLAAGLDCYFFNRFMRLLLRLFTPMVLILAALLPIHHIGHAPGNAGMDKLSFANLNRGDKKRWVWAHVVIMIAVVTYFCLTIAQEMISFIEIRQNALTSTRHRIKARSSTILIEQIPSQYLDHESLENFYSFLPGGIKNIWFNRNFKELEKKVDERRRIHKKLEELETSLVIKVMQRCIEDRRRDDMENGLGKLSIHGEQTKHISSETASIKASRRGKSSGDPHEIERLNTMIMKNEGDTQSQDLKRDRRRWLRHPIFYGKASRSKEHINGPAKELLLRKEGPRTETLENCPYAYSERILQSGDIDAIWQSYISPEERVTIRLGRKLVPWLPRIPFVGEKVDAIQHHRKWLAELNLQIEKDQRNHYSFPLLGSAFVQFNRQIDAHVACQSVHYHRPRHMAYRLVEVDPRGIVWKNLGYSWTQLTIRKLLLFLVVVGLNIAWLFPVAFAGALSRFDQIAQTLDFLSPLRDWPPSVQNTIQGILPPFLMTIYMVILPPILRFLVKISGIPTTKEISLQLQRFLFGFMLVQQVFATTTSASVTAVLGVVSQNPLEITDLLARDLPTSANFFYAFLLLQAFFSSAANLAQPMNLLKRAFKRPKSPRERYEMEKGDQNEDIAAQIPVVTMFGVIGLLFCVIAPLVILFVVLSVLLYWFAWRYLLLYVIRPKADSTGLIYPNALNQLFAGVYLMELSLIGLISLIIKDEGAAGAKGQLILVTITLVITALFQLLLNRTFQPLIKHLPISLENESADCLFAFEAAERTKWAPILEHQQQSFEIAALKPKVIARVQHSETIRRSLSSSGRSKRQFFGSSAKNRRQLFGSSGRHLGQLLNSSMRREKAPNPSIVADSLNLTESESSNPSKLVNALERKAQEDAIEETLPLRSLSTSIKPVSVQSQEMKIGPSPESYPSKNTGVPAEQDLHTITRHPTHPKQSNGADAFRGAGMSTSIGKEQYSDRDVLESRAKGPPVEPGQPRPSSRTSNSAGNTVPLVTLPLIDGGYIIDLTDPADLSPNQRSRLTKLAFQHPAKRALRPCVWIPQDSAGVSEDVIKKTEEFSTPEIISPKSMGKERARTKEDPSSQQGAESVGMDALPSTAAVPSSSTIRPGSLIVESNSSAAARTAPTSSANGQDSVADVVRLATDASAISDVALAEGSITLPPQESGYTEDCYTPKPSIWISNDHAYYDPRTKKIVVGGRPPDWSLFWVDKHGEMDF